MNERQSIHQDEFAYDPLAGPVYAFRRITDTEARSLADGRDQPQIVTVLVWPYAEWQDPRPELRRYYALNLPQAVARATEIEIRLREQELNAVLVGIRPATAAETEVCFRAMADLESRIPTPIAAERLA